ncbi:hypothetical protein ABID82_004001 [Methylobacterium sp. PvP062]|uniref:Uncharacterized protein n=1 Tax=Methylobacterium radiotolerans TaxID=31998 RepID=A0ABV2NGD5_9HYPH|nr:MULTISPECIES: hypothetical protein [unclassified Methylobacterium]MBP2497796.1 hypothetical protein [Methylobacterium sp. PvP105]MBP2502333.1 hypothetical protein [Methylobacterium sp. PvP109]MCX7335105.1 hypothetical protein [Hyphomicrobiales bacterium]
MEAEFEIAGNRYRFDRMPAQTETRILRRFAPMIAEAVPLVLAPGPRIALRSNMDVQKVIQTVFRAWGRLSDDDTDMIERASCGSLRREHSGAWVPVWPKGDPEPAFPDIDGAALEHMVGYALGFTVKRWLEGGGEMVPAEIRAVIGKLH